ncbi:tripartite motif-containing protein 16-like isoform X2 [Silurus meridionalis]|nr:tripartite motif-containing protein 16-like isoform X2 [Silurus meridionalis]
MRLTHINKAVSLSHAETLVFVCEMAHAGVFLEHDQFNCSICLDVLKDPVTVPCGHSYCKACIKGYWDQDDYLGVYGCPQCRQSFTPRPVLGRNTMLADVVEKLKQTAIRAASAPKAEPSEAETSEAEPGEVPCDVCTGNRSLAVRSCLVCLASYCEDHLKPHYESAAFQKHRLTAPTSSLQDSLCPRHDKLLEVFCKTEQRCICYLCLTDEHKGHDTVLASTEISEKKDALAETQRKFQQRIEEREKDLEELRRATQSLTRSAKAALEESERIFTELVCSIERRRTEVKELIRAQERAATSQAEQLLRQLEQEIGELKKRDTELSQLAQIENQISFLQNYGSVCVQPVCMDVPCITVDPDFGCVMSALSEFQALIDDVCQGGFVNISEKAAATISVDEDQFCCPVCLEVLRDPVTIPCGHSYCMDCIKSYWKKTEHKSGYTCPQCRRGFSPRPALARNTVLAGLVEKLREKLRDAGIQEAPPVECDTCQGKKQRAVKSCLKCLGSYCETHLKQHKTHKLTDATRQLHKRVCNRHGRLFELYCRTDQQLVCTLCVTDGHAGHHTLPAVEERTEKQRQLEEALRKSKQRSKEKEKELRNIMKYLKRSAQAVEEDSEKICTKLLRSIERKHGEVKELLRAEERAALAQAEGLLESLDQQAEDTKRKEAELELLSGTDDHIHFLLKCKPLLVPADPDELPDVDVHPYFSLMVLRKAITELRARVNDVCDRELARISDLMCCEVTLDPNTANSFLCLSEGNRKVSTCYDSQHYPDHKERFSSWAQVLAREAISTRRYWEVEWSGSGGIGIGVSYKGINRHSGSADGKLGCNSKSWSINLCNGHCTFQHNKTKLEIPSPISARIGVYVDHKAGILAFYCISPRRDTMNLLHRIFTTFSHPLYPGFWLGPGSTLKLCSILKFSA